MVKLTASPGQGNAYLASWSGDLTGRSYQANVTMSKNTVITATFDLYNPPRTAMEGYPWEGLPLEERIAKVQAGLAENDAQWETAKSLGCPSTMYYAAAHGGLITLLDQLLAEQAAKNARFTLMVNITGQGSVVKNPDQPAYANGTSVQVTAKPAGGYGFTGWSGNLSGSVNPATITMNGNKTVTATFTRIQSPSPTVTAGVNFADPNLEKIIRQQIGKPAGNISPSDLEKITSLYLVPGSGGIPYVISNLSGLEYCTNLTTLALDRSGVKDLSPLANLTRLKDLSLGSMGLTDISALAKLTNLEKLSLTDNGLTDISILAKFTKLKTLSLSRNRINDISYLVKNPGIGKDDEISVSLNGLDLTDGSPDMADIKALIDRGVKVTYYPQYTSVFTLDIKITGKGAVNRDKAGPYPYGDIVTLRAEPETGWQFSEWGGDRSGNTNPATITMNANKTVTATFIPVASPSPTPTPPAPSTTPASSGGSRRSSGGGGGGGGGGGYLSLEYTNQYGKVAQGSVSASGKLNGDISACSKDGTVTLRIKAGSYVKNAGGGALRKIQIVVPENIQAIPEGVIPAGAAYSVGSESGTIEPAATLAWKYDGDGLPEGMSVENLYMAMWSEQENRWATLEGLDADDAAGTLVIPVRTLGTFAVFGRKPAAFVSSSFKIAPAEITAGEGNTVGISLTVTNVGGMTGAYRPELTVNGVAETAGEIMLAPGESREVNFTLKKDAPGAYQVDAGGVTGTFTVKAKARPQATAPASVDSNQFSIAPLALTPGEIFPGDACRITATVTNNGNAAGVCPVVLKINDVVENGQDVNLGVGERREVTFSVSRTSPGSYALDVNGVAGSLTVKEKTGLTLNGPWIIVFIAMVLVSSIILALFLVRRY